MPERSKDDKQATPDESRRRKCKSLLDNVFTPHRPSFSFSQQVWNPPADVYETSHSVIVKMEIPGVCLDTLQVTAEHNTLMVRGCRGEDSPQPKENIHLMEIRYGQFDRSFPLPGKLNLERITAQYSNGFLIVTIQKKPLVSRNIAVEIVEE
ncbi:MAG TPA: Hsp20/alpha crystallin family protein [Candidatus Sumerlaeota bacterium]|nr:Hsp20/alpha crystallin family protein [Candidatus Sumerlaeota bacterium]HPS01685.1 Hsp20/alpha crystallin family protein [Candidatus Sumerlaeota bacterium]